MTSHTHTASTGFALPKTDGGFAFAYRTLRARYVAYKTRQALSQLTARELDDIGLTAGDIDRIARRSAGL
jgi:uncharacterized protein YjiS (DUF1127 family)